MSDFSPEAMRARWQELTALREAADAELDPRRAELDSIVDGTFEGTLAEARAREPILRAEIIALQTNLHPIEQERAVIARGLGGKTG